MTRDAVGMAKCSECRECQAEMLLGSRPQFAGRSLHQWTGPKTWLRRFAPCFFLGCLIDDAWFALNLNLFEHV